MSLITEGLDHLAVRGALAALLALSVGGSCEPRGRQSHGHSHGHGSHEQAHGHGGGAHGHGHGKTDPVVLTRVSKTHELFVEFLPPIAGHALSFHAHVTRLADNAPTTAGRFTVRFIAADRSGANAGSQLVADKPTRPGIFIPRGTAPKAKGRYQLLFGYAHGSELSSWSSEEFVLGQTPARLRADSKGAITLLKEQQWTMDALRTEKPRRQNMARELRLPLHLEADPARIRSLLAPAPGVVVWDGEATVVGGTAKLGARLGRLLPAAAGGHWSTLQLKVRQAEIERDLQRRQLARLAKLAKEGLIARQRLSATEAALRRAEASARAARQQLASRRGRGGLAVALRAPSAGTIISLALASGRPAAVGQLLALIANTQTLLGRAQVHPSQLRDVGAIRRAWLDGAGPSRALSTKVLLTKSLVFGSESRSAPLTYRVDNSAGLLRVGQRLLLRLELGEGQPVLAVPRSAIVEINTRPYVFVVRSGESFERRAVQLGPHGGRWVAVSGLKANERIVSAGAFDVHAASLSSALTSHRH